MAEDMNRLPTIGTTRSGPKDRAHQGALAQPELTEDVRQAIRDLEDEKFIPALSKVLALATFLRLKPASEIATTESLDERLVSEAKERTIAILNKLALPHVSRHRTDHNGFNLERFFIALSDEGATSLQKLMESDEKSPAHNTKIGNALGIPRSAVDARESRSKTGDKSLLLSYEERLQFFGPELGAFFLFAPSRKHWQEEKVWLQDLVDKIKELSPEIYQQALRERT